MYSWSQYQAAMKKINKSLLPETSRSSKAWVRFSINDSPLSTYRMSHILKQINRNGYGRNFLPQGYLFNGELVSYNYYLNKLGLRNKNKKWKSYAKQIGSVYVLANKWIIPTPASFPTVDMMVYWFNKDNKIQKFNIGGIINNFFNSQSFNSGEDQFWTGGLNPDSYNLGYSLTPHKGGGGNRTDFTQYFWHPEKEGYVNMKDIKALTEAVYRRGETIIPVDSPEALRQVWGLKWISRSEMEEEEERIVFEKSYKKEAENIHKAYRFALPVIEPPQTQWIINYTNKITSLLKS